MKQETREVDKGLKIIWLKINREMSGAIYDVVVQSNYMHTTVSLSDSVCLSGVSTPSSHFNSVKLRYRDPRRTGHTLQRETEARGETHPIYNARIPAFLITANKEGINSSICSIL